MKDFESLTVISVECYCKVNPACFKCLEIIKNLEKNTEIEIQKSNQLHYFNIVIEIVTLLIIF